MLSNTNTEPTILIETLMMLKVFLISDEFALMKLGIKKQTNKLANQDNITLINVISK